VIRKRSGLIACLVLAMVALAACGSSSSKSTSNAATPSSGTGVATSAATPKGPAIVVGSICSCSGAQASVLAGNDKVAQAWASSVNASGGLNGHPVKMITLDDAGTPATSLQDAKELVTQDHVVAIVADMSLADSAWASYVASKGIPVVGGISDEPSFLTNPDFYPSGTQLVVSTVGVALAAKAAGATNLGVAYCAESPVCAELIPLAGGAAKLAGMKFSSVKISETSPSYAAQCLQLKSAGVDSLYVAENAPVVVRVADACVQAGYKVKSALNVTELSNVVLKDPNLNGAVGATGQANPFDTTLPATAQFQAALNKYAPGIVGTSTFAQPMMMAWAGLKLFQAAAQAGHLTPTSTPADVKKGLYALHNETLGGIAPPLNFTPGKAAFIPCYFTETISGGKFVSGNSNKPTCLTAAQATALEASLKSL
jgi:branched-chain amino acid transport system substrate-binding protein